MSWLAEQAKLASVIGSPGLYDLTALGSVSERVAHQARSSVLIVREHMAANRRGAGQ